MSTIEAPPPVLNSARVLAYAVIDESVQWTGRQRLYLGDKEVGPVPCLALCQNIGGGTKDILVFHCDNDWEVLGVTGGDTVDLAKAGAERAYRGVTAKWVEINVSVETAEAWMNENCEKITCSFCDRQVDEFTSLVESKASVRICNHCVGEFYAQVRKGND